MSPNNNLKRILIIDFGSQFTQLIARRVRELGVYSEIINHKVALKFKFNRSECIGIILSGGPLNVYQSNKVKINKKIFKLGIPILGICFGHQIIAKEMGGKIKNSKYREFGLAAVKRKKKSLVISNNINFRIIWNCGRSRPRFSNIAFGLCDILTDY